MAQAPAHASAPAPIQASMKASMKTVSEKVWLAAVGLIVLYSVYPNGVVSAEKISMDGLDPLSPRSGDGVTPTVSGKRVEIPLPDQPPVCIEGWPAFL